MKRLRTPEKASSRRSLRGGLALWILGLAVSACGYVGLDLNDQDAATGGGGEPGSGGSSAGGGAEDTGGSPSLTGGAEHGGGGAGGDRGALCPYEDPLCAQLSEGLVHRYSFDGTSAVLRDSSGDADGIIHGAALTGEGSLTLSGSNEYVELPSGMISNLSAVSLEIWFTWHGGETWQRLFDFGSTDADGEPETYLYVTLRADGLEFLDDEIAAGISHEEGQTNEDFLLTKERAVTDELTQIVLVVDDEENQMTLYRNGESLASDAINVRLDEIDDSVGSLGRSIFARDDPEFNGVLHEFRIYESALDADAVKKSFTSGNDAVFDAP